MYIHTYDNYVKILKQEEKLFSETFAGFAPTITRVRDSNTIQKTMRDTHSGQLF